MYMRPPGYNAESARAAEIADERKKLAALEAPSDIQDESLAIVSQGYTHHLALVFACSTFFTESGYS